jgi:hypothetical protein
MSKPRTGKNYLHFIFYIKKKCGCIYVPTHHTSGDTAFRPGLINLITFNYYLPIVVIFIIVLGKLKSGDFEINNKLLKKN